MGVHSKLFREDAVICRLELVYRTPARPFPVFLELCLPDSGFHVGFPLDFWMSWSFPQCNVFLEYPVNKNLCFFAQEFGLARENFRVSIC